MCNILFENAIDSTTINIKIDILFKMCYNMGNPNKGGIIMDKLNLEITKNKKIKAIEYKGEKFKVTTDKDLRECLDKLTKIFGYEEMTRVMNDEVNIVTRSIFKKKNVFTAGIASATLAFLLTSSAGCYSSKENNKDEDSQVITASEEREEKTEEKTDYEKMTVEELIKLLPEEIRNSWKMMDEFQDYFNNTAAPTIKISEDNEAQLYLKSKEVAAYYILANSHNLTTEELANIFKGSGLEAKDTYSKLMLQMSKVLWTYYAYATETSGISMLYEDKKDKEIVEKAENYILEYNKTKEDKVIDDLNKWLEDLFFGGHIDKITETNPGATSYIGNILLPLCKENGWVSEEKLEDYEKTNENTTCDYFLNNRYQDIKKLIESSNFDYKLLTSDVNDEILDYLKDSLEDEKKYSSIKKALFDQMDEENIKVSSRDIDIEAREVKELGYVIEGDVIYAENETIKEEIIETTQDKEITREEAVEQFGEEKVEEAEKEAEEEFHEQYDDYNKQEEEKAQNITTAYNIVYNLARDNAANGKTLSEITSIVKAELEAQGINATGMNVSDWINIGYEDGKAEWEAFNKPDQIIKEEITEEYIENLEPSESSTNNSDNNSNDIQESDKFELPEEESSLPNIPEDEYYEESIAIVSNENYTVLEADTFELPEESIVLTVPQDEYYEEVLPADSFELPAESYIWDENQTYEEIEEEFFTEEELSSSRSR